MTHRGPLIDSDDSGAGGVLYGSSFPKLLPDKYYSFQWAGLEPYESVFELQAGIRKCKSADDLFKLADNLGIYHSIPL